SRPWSRVYAEPSPSWRLGRLSSTAAAPAPAFSPGWRTASMGCFWAASPTTPRPSPPSSTRPSPASSKRWTHDDRAEHLRLLLAVARHRHLAAVADRHDREDSRVGRQVVPD